MFRNITKNTTEKTKADSKQTIIDGNSYARNSERVFREGYMHSTSECKPSRASSGVPSVPGFGVSSLVIRKGSIRGFIYTLGQTQQGSVAKYLVFYLVYALSHCRERR